MSFENTLTTDYEERITEKGHTSITIAHLDHLHGQETSRLEQMASISK